MRPLQRAYTPRDGAEARRLLAEETRSQLSLLPSDIKRYGILLDPAFHEYLRGNPVVLPLTLIRRFHNRPLFWDAASYLLYRCRSARTPCVIPWKIVRRQLASVDQLDRRLALGAAGGAPWACAPEGEHEEQKLAKYAPARRECREALRELVAFWDSPFGPDAP